MLDLSRLSYQGDFDANTTYQYHDTVRYGTALYACIEGVNVSGVPPLTTDGYWQQVLPDAWQSGSLYWPNQLALANGAVYVALNVTNGTTDPSQDTTHWQSVSLIPGGSNALDKTAGGTVTGAVTFDASTNFNDPATFNSPLTTQGMLEKVTLDTTALTGTVNVDALTDTVIFYTAPAAANWAWNFRGDARHSLDSQMAVGQAVSFAMLATQGATGYYPTTLTVDGNAATVKWSGAGAPTAGDANDIDSYAITVIKTAAATFTVLATQTKFA